MADSDPAVFVIPSADFGDPVEFEEALPAEDAERYEKQLDDFDEAHAEAEAGLQDLSAG